MCFRISGRPLVISRARYVVPFEPLPSSDKISYFSENGAPGDTLGIGNRLLENNQTIF